MDKRYQSADVAAIWSDQGRNLLERSIWIKVMRVQREAGIDIPEDIIDMYSDLAASQAELDPDSEEASLEAMDIAELEKETKHDLYARLRWFNEAVGADHAHRGLTSSDVTENAQQMQIVASAELLVEHAEQVLRRMYERAGGLATVPIVARTHGRPAQLTTIGKRITDWMQELMGAMVSLQGAIEGYVPRGVKGAVGTSADMARALLPGLPEGSPAGRWVAARLAAGMLDTNVSNVLAGETSSMLSTGQCYPRSADLPIISAALQLAAACGTVATAVRLMSALDLVVENPEAHVGSSAMPHKSNPRYSERICSLQIVARGYAGMLQETAGMQWLEGDVSTSAARRVALPGLFHTVDSMLANTALVLDHLEFDLAAIDDERMLWMPEMASGALLAALVENGVPRQRAHEVLRHHYREIGSPDCESNRVLTLAFHMENEDQEFRLTKEQIEAAFDPQMLVGSAVAIVEAVVGAEFGELLADADPEWPGDLV
jgi:adenylosuccinate lyase